MLRLLRCCSLLVLPFLSAVAVADATVPTKDIPGAKDPSWLKRYEGSLIVSYEHKAFDAVAFPASKLEGSEPARYDDRNNAIREAKRMVTAEGEYTRLLYVAPEERSPLEVMRNYIDMIKADGGKLLYGCRDEGCGGNVAGYDPGGNVQTLLMKLLPPRRMKDAAFSNGACTVSHIDGQRYVLATVPDGSGGQRTLAVVAFGIDAGTYCEALKDRTGVLVVAVEPKARERKMVTVTATEMARALDASGHIALYGLYFDTNKSAVKPDSKPTLEQIEGLLNVQPKLKLAVVGHTDNVGDAKYNKALSQRRADAVVAALVEDYGIAPERLEGSGAGMEQPVAGNDSEDGRAKNRRVELVKR